MNLIETAESPETCGECGARHAKIARVHKGIRYCQTCYKRLFKRRLCPECGNFARLPVHHSGAICRPCESRKPCVRCRRVGRKIGKLTPDGPACNSCAPHFRKPKPCEACGQLSTRLSRKASLGHNLRVCEKCARINHKTCNACQRHRPLVESTDGRKLCTVCLEKGEVTCPTCGQLMPAGYGQQCRMCYWTGLAKERIQSDCDAFTSEALTNHFQAFGKWLIGKVEGHKAALTIHRYLEFFLEIERQWQDIPDYERLLGHFSAGGLRRYLLPMRWMNECGLVISEAGTREADSDRRRTEASLNKFQEGSHAHTILNRYHESLLARLEKNATTLRSIRLAISPAASLLIFGELKDRMPPDQKTLDEFLRKSPGQRAALSGFVTYLREKHNVDMTLPKRDLHRARRQRRKKLETEMLTLMRDGVINPETKQRWLCVALAYFHDLPVKTGKNIKKEDVSTDGNGMNVRANGACYWIPSLDAN